MEMKKSVLTIVTILVFAVSILAPAHSVNALQSVSEGSTKTTITLNESVDFWVDVKPSSRINWYCDDVLAKSEYSLHSNYTFNPKATGTYLISLSVAGFTKPSGPTKVTVIAAPMPSPTPIQTPQHSVIRFYNDTHFALRQTLWAFDGYHLVGSFNATANDYLDFNIVSTNSDKDRPNDVFTVEFKIESNIHGTSYVSGTTFNQKVSLNYTDTYAISVAKFPFYSSVTVVGSIDLRRSDLATPTPTQSNNTTLQPAINTGAEPPQTEPILIVLIVVVSIFTVLAVAGLLVYHKKQK
jgi:hypothetical protein